MELYTFPHVVLSTENVSQNQFGLPLDPPILSFYLDVEVHVDVFRVHVV